MLKIQNKVIPLPFNNLHKVITVLLLFLFIYLSFEINRVIYNSYKIISGN